jgi:hypothetical protein
MERREERSEGLNVTTWWRGLPSPQRYHTCEGVWRSGGAEMCGRFCVAEQGAVTWITLRRPFRISNTLYHVLLLRAQSYNDNAHPSRVPDSCHDDKSTNSQRGPFVS